MPNRNLQKKPLNEAIVELKWELPVRGSPFPTDPNYQLLLGRFYERISPTFPAHEALPASSLPDGMLPALVQHRFRRTDNGWPLAQIGSGIVTFNETEAYDWVPFRDGANAVIGHLFEAYPSINDKLKVSSLQLRFVDTIPFDYEKEDTIQFLAAKLKVNFSFPSETFKKYHVVESPRGMLVHTAFQSTRPPGKLNLKISTALKEDQKILVLETIFETTTSEGLPEMPSGFRGWADEAHAITTDLFFEMIKGDLEESFA